jgi:hypothetical protein
MSDHHLDFIRKAVAGDPVEQPKQVVGDLTRIGGVGPGFTKLKTPQEMHEEEMRMLAEGGADHTGKEQLRRAIFKMSGGQRGIIRRQ